MARTREEIGREYKVVAGIIISPGKFEREPVYAPHYWDLGLEGCADEVDEDGFSFKLDASDVERWPELAGVKTLRLAESDLGFVHTFKEG